MPYRRTAIIALPVILSVFVHGIIAGTILNMLLHGEFSGFNIIQWTNEQLTTCLIVTMMVVGCFYPGWKARIKALELKSVLFIALLAAIQVAISFSQWLSITSIAIIPCLIAIARLGFLWSLLVTGGFMIFSSVTQAYFYTSANSLLPPALFFPELFAHRMNTAMVAVFSIFMSDLVSQRNRLLKGAQRHAETDRLTGLHNRHYVLKAFERAAVRMPIGLVIIDIDNFKQINDRHGHHVGDEVLAAVSAKIRKLVRHKTDIAARWGGEEFLLILSDISPADLKSVCNRLVEDIGSMPLELATGPFPVTISAGATHLVNLLSRDFAQALSSADMLLYQAKRSGKNRVIFNT
ncbi:GGDEF domain-containing protein [Rhizobium sp. ZPR3]|uniref:diguanylate cyclase n=2 Tax=unclassified Rhizobium TaxID=2613769 RepID=A0AAU7SPL9_9HYPH